MLLLQLSLLKLQYCRLQRLGRLLLRILCGEVSLIVGEDKLIIGDKINQVLVDRRTSRSRVLKEKLESLKLRLEHLKLLNCECRLIRASSRTSTNLWRRRALCNRLSSHQGTIISLIEPKCSLRHIHLGVVLHWSTFHGRRCINKLLWLLLL